jgi:hypothetical protein
VQGRAGKLERSPHHEGKWVELVPDVVPLLDRHCHVHTGRRLVKAVALREPSGLGEQRDLGAEGDEPPALPIGSRSLHAAGRCARRAEQPFHGDEGAERVSDDADVLARLCCSAVGDVEHAADRLAVPRVGEDVADGQRDRDRERSLRIAQHVGDRVVDELARLTVEHVDDVLQRVLDTIDESLADEAGTCRRCVHHDGGQQRREIGAKGEDLAFRQRLV